MKPYYVMIHFDGPYVNGFVVPQAESPKHALKILKRAIWARIKFSNQKGIGQHISLGEDNVPRLKMYMRSLKRPWRFAGDYRGQAKPQPKKSNGNNRGQMVRIEELLLPVHTGYWLKDIVTGNEICNTPTKESDGSTQESVAAG